MTRLDGWKQICAAFLLFTASAMSAAAQTFTILFTFDITNGARPNVPLVQGRDGNFYGVTPGGGAYSEGTVFKMTPTGTLTTLYSFCAKLDCADGAGPTSLVLGTDGNFYGTTSEGGADGGHCHDYGCGTVFQMTPAGDLTTLLAFPWYDDEPDGAGPIGLIQADDGSFYGPANGGGTKGYGTIFSLSPPDTFNFWNLWPHGNQPTRLIQGSDGNFYGLTYGGTSDDLDGSIFKMTPSGDFPRRFEFSGSDGRTPDDLMQAVNGNFYGTTTYGGASTAFCFNNGCGTFFAITPSGSFTTLYNFCAQTNCVDGSIPVGVIQATDGNFYGVTEGTDENEGCCGIAFQITPEGSLTPLHSFCQQANCPDGSGPGAVLLQATNGTFYGTTVSGGYEGYAGIIFSLSMGFGPFVAFLRKSAKIGQTFGVLGQGFTGTTRVSFNGIPARFTVEGDTFLVATVPRGATTGYVTVSTPNGMLTSNVPFYVIP